MKRAIQFSVSLGLLRSALNLPDNIEIKWAGYDPLTGYVKFVVESPEFPLVADGVPPYPTNPEYRRVTDEAGCTTIEFVGWGL